jgi:hypothetical protein
MEKWRHGDMATRQFRQAHRQAPSRAKGIDSVAGVDVAGANQTGVIEVSLDLGHGLLLRIVRR